MQRSELANDERGCKEAKRIQRKALRRQKRCAEYWVPSGGIWMDPSLSLSQCLVVSSGDRRIFSFPSDSVAAFACADS
jgi:hypothetical protein